MISEEDGYASPVIRKPLVFRINESGVGPEVIREVLLDRGWEEFVEGETEEYDWNLWWRTNRFRQCDYNDQMPWQRLNHFCKTIAITKKDTLARNMRRMRGVYGNTIYNFAPLAFNLPNDYTKFVAEYSKSQQEQGGGNQRALWICKPADMSRGRGIFIFEDLSDLTYDCSAVAQKYLTNPLLIGGYKFDLRIYVLVTSFNPLHIYMYQEGIARFSTEKFDLSSLGNMFSHLTNTSINKLGPSYTTFKEGVGPGCKWSLTMLRNYFHQQGIDDEVLWQRICNIVTLTMLAQAPTVPKTPGCVELFGFDILIDENLKPWLLEVNFSPALGLDCQIDQTIKRALINDIIDLMQFQDGDEARGGEHFTKLKQKQAYSSNRRGTLGGARKGVVAKPGLRNKPSNSNLVGSPSRSSSISGRGSVSKFPSKTKLPSNDRQGSRNKGVSQGTMSNQTSQKQSKDESEDDYDEEIDAVCKRTSSEVNIKEGAQSSQSRQSGKPGSALSALMLPSLEETRKQLDSRRELIRSRQEQKQTSPSSPMRRPSVTSQRQTTSSKPNLSRPGTQSHATSNRSHSQSRQTSRASRHTETKQSGRASNIDTSRTRPGFSNHNSKMTPTPVSRPMMSKTGLRSNVKSERSSMMNEKGASSIRAKSKDTTFPPPAKSKPAALPPQRVGDFVLTFPFNEATRRASFPSLDIRTIIRETQKLLRRTICKAHSTKRVTQAASRVASQRAAGGSVRQQFEEVVIQWVPLKSPLKSQALYGQS